MNTPDSASKRDVNPATVPVPQEVVREAVCAVVYEDDHEEKTLQAHAEPVEKEMINDVYTSTSVVTTVKAQMSHPGYGH